MTEVNERVSVPDTKNHRMKFISKIRDQMPERSKTFLVPPKEHWLNPELFILRPQFDDAHVEKINDAPKLNKSWLTVLSIWNCMIGSSIVSVPAATKEAGIIPTVVLCFIFCFICYYTCQVVVKTGGRDNDYSDTVERYFGTDWGRLGKVLQITFSILINVGALYIYFLIINQHLFPVLKQIFGIEISDDHMLDITFSRFSIAYSSILVCALLFPFIVKKDINFLLKINSLGVYCVVLIISFILYNFIKSLLNTDFEIGYVKNTEGAVVSYLQLFGPDISKLAGMLSLGYFSHSIILPILKNNEKQENNKRDLLIGYLLVCVTYIFIGVTGYIGFSGKEFKGRFEDNWFYLCDPKQWHIMILRLLSFFQLCSIFPIISYVIRVQLFGTFYNNNYPSRKHIIVYSILVCLSSFAILCLFIKNLSKFIGYIGAGTGLFLIYVIPLGVNTIYYRIKHPNSRHIRNLLLQGDDKINNNFDYQQTNDNEFGLAVSEKSPSALKDNLFYISQVLLIVFGLFTLILQFVPINFFNVHLADPKLN